ncbi:hypothetical protein EV141_1435 [Microcella putealis]|uniref:Uncharacterized protein n=2 Tax=Microcella putealis TaxID=337005 RepID=A0A4Q7LU15_9MICO|nr:hypothetical protein EV141_1435 [Microcella putealis]
MARAGAVWWAWGMSDDERTPNRNAAFLPIGITFLAVGLAFLFGPSISLSWAFIPIGITFIVIWLSGREQADDDGDGDGDSPKKPDPRKGDGSVTPVNDTDRGDSSDGTGGSGGDGGGGGGD